MNTENLEIGSKIIEEISVIDHDLFSLRDMETNPAGDDIMYYGTSLSAKATEQIRTIAIKSLVNRRTTLRRQFKKL